VSVDEWDQREVCPDGGCVGVIGPDGLCKVCGRAAQHWGDERKRGMVARPPSIDEEAPAIAATTESVPADDTDDYEWSRRKLCVDDACVGLLGTDGKCKVCGKSAA
jgi:hypothetical protein